MPTWLIITLVIAAIWLAIDVADRIRKKDLERQIAEKQAEVEKNYNDMFVR